MTRVRYTDEKETELCRLKEENARLKAWQEESLQSIKILKTMLREVIDLL